MKGGLKNALLVCTGAYSTDGGIAAVNRLTAQAFVEKGYFLDIYSLVERNTKIDAHFLPQEAQIHYKSFAEKKLLFTFAVWQTLLQKSYDFILVDHVNLASILAPLAWLKHINYTVWLCGIEVFPPRPDIQGKLGLMGASNRLAISEFTRQSVISRFPDLLINGCDLSLDPIRHAYISRQPQSESSCTPIVMEAIDGTCHELEDRVILHVGRMTVWERYKGQESSDPRFPHGLPTISGCAVGACWSG